MNIKTFDIDISIVVCMMIVVNAIIAGICICRLKEMNAQIRTRVKYQYVIGIVMAVANGLSPILFRQWPNTVGLLFSMWVCYMLWSDDYQWKNGPPVAALKEEEVANG